MTKAGTVKKPRVLKKDTMTAVKTGWVVKKLFRVKEPDPKRQGEHLLVRKERVISKLFTSESAANRFLELVKKYPPPCDSGELDPEYFVTTKDGFDDLPAGL